jgi:UDP-N-acetyl-D-mannosaminuronic acid dehydrogenase
VALAHDLAKLCDALPYSLDVLEIIAGANSLKKGQHFVNILTPSNGVGGYCLTKDPWFVHALGSHHGLELLTPKTSRAVNDGMPSYCAEQIAAWSGRQHRPPDQVRIAVLGLAFKSNSGDVRHTPVVPLLSALRDRGFGRIVVHDPTVLPEHAAQIGVELQPSMRCALEGADCVLYLAGHDSFRTLPPSGLAALVSRGALVFDGRMYFDHETIAEFRALGLQYQGVGR